MAGEMAGWRRERRPLPGHLIAEAAANPGGSVAEIDGSVVSGPDGYVPAEAIIGCYLIGPDGRATGEYVHNPSYGPVRDDWARLESPDRWLAWLPERILTGVLTWIATGLDMPGTRRDRVWLDFGMTRQHAEELLQQRAHEASGTS